MKYLALIQARLGSTRFPEKVLQTVGGTPLVRRVWIAAKIAESIIGKSHMKTLVAWPERYPDLDENNVLERFRRISTEFPSDHIIRLTADCPLIESKHIVQAIREYESYGVDYYNNRKDGYDVQVFTRGRLFDSEDTHKEHVINDTSNTGGCSVNTKTDLMRVRLYAR